MKYWKWMMLIMLLPIQASWTQSTPPHIKLNVQVLGRHGKAIEGAKVAVGFPGRISGQGESFKENTGKNGLVSFRGSSFFKLPLIVKKEGYYDSKVEVTTFERVDRKNVYSDQEVKVILREVKNPIPMYAYEGVQARIPKLHEPIGFDLVKGDWVSPYGKGLTADLFIEMTGNWKEYRNHDSVLKLTFPNDGDGVISFKAKKQSQFKSPYEAPPSGYLSKKSWRKSRKPVEGVRHKWDIIDETSHDANYVFRIRTVLDRDGEVEQAFYGKIYGDFAFDGATLEEERFSYIVFTYYLNPTQNDRNLEFKTSENLLEGLRSWQNPSVP